MNETEYEDVSDWRRRQVQDAQLRELVREFFDDYLDAMEESDGGNLFNPIHISCSRSLRFGSLGILLVKMRQLSGSGLNGEEK